MKEFKIRASACGQIMKNPKSGSGLSETAKSYCENWYREQLYNRRHEFVTKYTQRGNESEQDSLDYVAERLGYGILLKNEQHFEGVFMTGTPDAILKNLVIDVKSSWSWETIPIFDTECPNKDYFYQAQIYMHLTGIHSYKLCYTLMDTPAHMIEKEAYYWCKNNGYDELEMDIFDQFVAKMTYSDVPDELKLKVFDIEYNSEVIEQINAKVLLCREYIKTLNHK